MTASPALIDVAGGGPTGLVFAPALQAFGVPARVRVFDKRWLRDRDGTLRWRGPADGQTRRQQIVTLQSNVWLSLPTSVQHALFGPRDFTEVWPCSSDSPADRGRPRNLPISDIEDRLLELARGSGAAELVAERYDPALADAATLVAVCEGAHAATREHFIGQFGQPHRDLYTLDANVLQETLLGIDVRTTTSAAETVLLTVAQNRYLLNIHRGRGFLNIRLGAEEAARLPEGERVAPGLLRASSLWPVVSEGLAYFGIAEDHAGIARTFRCALVHRPRFVAQVGPRTWACLLGDAANALHLWPGRGLNTGFKSALSLARCLARRWRGHPLRAADLLEHEGVMQMLQAREVGNRAWQSMLIPDRHGRPRPIGCRIAAGLHGPIDRPRLLGVLGARLAEWRARLQGRIEDLPDDGWIEARLASLSGRTLKVLVESGPWVTSEVGGPEIDVAAWLPLPARKPAA